MRVRILPDRNSKWPLQEYSIEPGSCRPDTPLPRFGGPQAPAKNTLPPKLSQRGTEKPVVIVHCRFPGAYRRKCHSGRVSGPSGVVGKHVFNNADRIRSFGRADRLVHSVFRSAGPGLDRHCQVEFWPGGILSGTRSEPLYPKKLEGSVVCSRVSGTNDRHRPTGVELSNPKLYISVIYPSVS